MATAATSLLDSERVSASSERDALNRVLTPISPDDSEVIYTYDEGGALQVIEVKRRGSSAADTIVGDISYNARGQRESVDRYRALRLASEEFVDHPSAHPDVRAAALGLVLRHHSARVLDGALQGRLDEVMLADPTIIIEAAPDLLVRQALMRQGPFPQGLSF